MDRVPGIDKLVEVAGAMLASWRSRKEGQARIIAAEADSQVLLIRAEACRKARDVLALDGQETVLTVSFREIVGERIAYQEAKRIANIQSVTARAADELDGRDVPDTDPDHDWIARFFDDVQDVSSAEMQTLWAKVLAGQVERPGGTSIRSLGRLRELDRMTAELFAGFCSACVFLELDSEMIDARIPAFEGKAASNSLRPFGFGFQELIRLHEYGLIISDYDSWREYEFSIRRENRPLIPLRFQGHSWILEPVTDDRPDPESFRFEGPSLSQAGMELSRVVECQPLPHYAAKLQAFLLGRRLRMRRVA